jgi:hypothetical protein
MAAFESGGLPDMTYEIGDLVRHVNEYKREPNDKTDIRGRVVSVVGDEVVIMTTGAVPFHATFKPDELEPIGYDMTDYGKMTKAELIEALTLAYSDISALEDINADFMNPPRQMRSDYPSGWWVGVVLFAAIVTPWLLIGMWVLS